MAEADQPDIADQQVEAHREERVDHDPRDEADVEGLAPERE